MITLLQMLDTVAVEQSMFDIEANELIKSLLLFTIVFNSVSNEAGVIAPPVVKAAAMFPSEAVVLATFVISRS